MIDQALNHKHSFKLIYGSFLSHGYVVDLAVAARNWYYFSERTSIFQQLI